MSLPIKRVDLACLTAIKAFKRKVLQIAIDLLMYNLSNDFSNFVVPNKMKVNPGVIMKQVNIQT